MLHKTLRNYSASFNGFFIGVAFCSITSCGSGPKVRVYISNPSAAGMDYYDERTGEKGFVTYSVTDKFVCMTQVDLSAALDYCAANK